jgi:hypothetical protein
MTGVWIVVAVLLAATAFGLWNRSSSGRIKDSAATAGVVAAREDDPLAEIEADRPAPPVSALTGVLQGRLGSQATMVQFSSAFSAMRATRRISRRSPPWCPELPTWRSMRRTISTRAGARHPAHPDRAVLDATGRQVKHASGLPRKADVIAALGEIIPGRQGPEDFTI